MKTVIATLERGPLILGWTASILIIPLIFSTCYEVVARYGFKAPTIWAYEMGYMLTGAFFLLGGAFTLKQGGHIRVDMLYARFSRKTQAWINILFLGAVIFPLVCWMSAAFAQYFLVGWQTGETSGNSAWNPPVWPFRLVYLIGFAALAMQLLAEILKHVQVLLGSAQEVA